MARPKGYNIKWLHRYNEGIPPAVVRVTVICIANHANRETRGLRI
jgi:hypothetical protein